MVDVWLRDFVLHCGLVAGGFGLGWAVGELRRRRGRADELEGLADEVTTALDVEAHGDGVDEGLGEGAGEL